MTSQGFEVCQRTSSKRRSCLKWLYIAVFIWAVLLICVHLSGRLNTMSETNAVDEINIFEKWHKANRRNFMEGQQSSLKHLERKLNEVRDHDSQNSAPLYVNVRSNDTMKDGIDFLETLYFDKNKDIPEISCQQILEGDREEIDRTKLAMLQLKSKSFEKVNKELMSSDEQIAEMAKNCQKFRTRRKYIMSPLSPEEESYPIAYIFTIHRDLVSFEQLLRSIYHPQNIYCVHVDSKSSEKFHSSVAKVTDCFENVFIASTLTKVSYAHWTRVQADINCLKDLVKKKDEYPWKYVINLCGQDFPTKTNFETVRTLKSLRGFNSLETIHTPVHKKKRYEFQYVLPKDPKGDHALMKKTENKKSPPPGNIEMFAGGAYFVFKREAIEYMLTDSIIQEFFKWNEDSYSPDEHMWASLQRIYPQMPGSFPPHEKYDMNELQTISRIIKWSGLDKTVYPKCEGRFLRGVCVYGCGDLAWLIQQHHLFANKFNREIDVFAIHCLDNYIRNRTIIEEKLLLLRGYV